jgi:hypothetical protein
MGYLRYRKEQNRFRTEFEQDFQGNFIVYLRHLKSKYGEDGLTFLDLK